MRTEAFGGTASRVLCVFTDYLPEDGDDLRTIMIDGKQTATCVIAVNADGYLRLD
jgi:hypothetical protein